jgi:hypothetical protein
MFQAWPTRSPVTDGVLNWDRERYVILSEGWPDLYQWCAALEGAGRRRPPTGGGGGPARGRA